MGNLGNINVRIQEYNEKTEQLIPIFIELERNKIGKFHNNHYICSTIYNIQGIGILNHMFNYCRMQGVESLMFIIKREEDE